MDFHPVGQRFERPDGNATPAAMRGNIDGRGWMLIEMISQDSCHLFRLFVIPFEGEQGIKTAIIFGPVVNLHDSFKAALSQTGSHMIVDRAGTANTRQMQ